MQTLYALDLTDTPDTERLWRKQPGSLLKRAPALDSSTNLPELPPSGFASPLGFWFAAADSWTNGTPRFRVELFDPDERGRTNPGDDPLPRDGLSERRTIRVRLRAPAGRARDNTKPTLTIVLEIDSNAARVDVDADTWSNVGGTVLFAVAQYWRFGAIDRRLGELSAWARDDVAKTGGIPSVIRPGRSRELRARRRMLQSLILDLPDFEGALTNPRGHLKRAGEMIGGPLTPALSPKGASGNGGGTRTPALTREAWGLTRRVRLYRRLSASLGLDRWRCEIDERVEVVEAVFDSLTESLDHFQSLAFQIALELIIVAVLLLDVALYFLDARVLK